MGPTLCDQPPRHQPMYPSTPCIFPRLGAVCKQVLEAQTWDGPLTGSKVAQMSPARALHGCCAVSKCLSLPYVSTPGDKVSWGLALAPEDLDEGYILSNSYWATHYAQETDTRAANSGA